MIKEVNFVVGCVSEQDRNTMQNIHQTTQRHTPEDSKVSLQSSLWERPITQEGKTQKTLFF
jgi:hypothetical protein